MDHAQLPPGPRSPAAFQTLGWWSRPTAYLEHLRARYGNRFTIRLLLSPPFVHLGDPDEIKQVFQAPPEVLHPGEGARILEPIVGRHSVILLDEAPHLEQRKLMLPAFHGEKMAALAGLVDEVAEAETAAWPRDEVLVLHPRLQGLTLEIILRAVFGLEAGPRLDALRSRLTELLEIGATPIAMFPALQRPVLGRGPGARFQRLIAETDALIFELVEERRSGAQDGSDILSLLVGARHEDGSPMSDAELRDELVTMLVAGHETTASQLAWAFEILARTPEPLRRLTEAVDAGEDAYLTATIQEVMRRRPVLPIAEPRLTMQEVTIGDWTYPAGICLAANGYLVHHDPAIYPDPFAFRPERFLEQAPGTYTWLPFGGGRRRCLGASFATLEMRSVLKAVLGRYEIAAGFDGVEGSRRRSITHSPRHGALTVLRDRPRAAAPPDGAEDVAAAAA